MSLLATKSILHVRVEIGEICRIIGGGRKGQLLPFTVARRSESENPIEASNQIEFSTRDIGRRTQRESRREDSFTHNHEFRIRSMAHETLASRTTALFPLSLNFHAHFGDASN